MKIIRITKFIDRVTDLITGREERGTLEVGVTFVNHRLEVRPVKKGISFATGEAETRELYSVLHDAFCLQSDTNLAAAGDLLAATIDAVDLMGGPPNLSERLRGILETLRPFMTAR